jgi:putative oxidoreductase
MKVLFVLGRIAFGGFFLYNGINHFRKAREMSEYTAAKNIPMPTLGVYASGVALAAGGASVLLGLKPKLGAAAIVAFLAGVSPLMHDFWNREDPGQQQSEMIHFSKNMALLGATLALMGMEEPWPVSVPLPAERSTAQRLRKVVHALAA